MEKYIIILLGILIILCLVIIVLLIKKGDNKSLISHFDSISNLLIQNQNQNNNNQTNNLMQINKTLQDNALLEDQKLNNIRTTVDENLKYIRDDNNKKLEEMRKTVNEKLDETLNNRLTKSFETVSLQLQKVHEGLGEMQTLASGVGDLKKVLSNVKSRGILGEIQLGTIMEDILTSSQYDTNVSTIPGSTERVEFALKLPADDGKFIYLPIDSKFPADCYMKYQSAVESGSKEQTELAKKELTARLKSEAKDICEKYVQVPYTTEFAIMFLPTEGLYSTCCDMGLLDQLQKNYKITISGPSTMAALLNSLQMGFKTLAIQKRSSEVWELLGSIKYEFGKFAQALDKTQQRIQQTSDELDNLVGARTRAINKQLDKIQANNIPMEKYESLDYNKED